MAGIVVIFDFDCTIIDNDSDSWIINEFGITDIFKQLRPTMPWNELMDRMMKELHSQGRTVEEIAGCLKKIPLHLCAISAIQEAYALGCELRVVSDANMFYIETVLKHHGILELFSKIHTNPSYVDNEGRLNILPYYDSTTGHGCHLCPPNMCKGKIIEGIQTSSNQKKKFIYLGDGRGDYCPSLKLCEGDYLMPRKNYPLWNIITNRTDEEQKLLKAEVHEWSNYEEFANSLIQIINKLAFVDAIKNTSDQLMSAECKDEKTSASAGLTSVPIKVPE